ncbi:MAG TPA: Ig-like domain-containing protein [Longimicrobiaceae bacterium]|nr:Ig-like domain-containing protein [Longimicrobiaceae bacterium]
MILFPRWSLRGRGAAIGAALLGSTALAACAGDNLFVDPARSGGGGSATVQIQAPDSGQRVAVGDSVFVQVRASDPRGIVRVELSGVALSGSAALGTLTATPRFVPKVVDLQGVEPLVRDTVLARYLLPTGDSIPADTVILVARVTDRAGNESADTVRIAIGGPRVHIVSPAPGAQVRPGGQLSVSVTAADTANRVQSLRLVASGAATADTLLRFDPPRGSVDTLVMLDIPGDAAAGELQLRAIVRNTANDSTVSPPLRLQVLAPATDTRPPTIRFSTRSASRVEARDSFTVTVVASDDVRVDRVGATLLAINRLATRTDTLGALPLSQAGDSATFRVSLAQLNVAEPADTSRLRIETTAFAYDTAGNCATSTVPNTELSDPCVLRADTVYASRSGARSEFLLVRGRTAAPEGVSDRLADLTIDVAGQRVFVSNFSRNRVEVLPFGTQSFSASIVVGAEPWGVTLGVSRDTLFVANSAGTNISVVPLATLQEVESLRIRPADVRLYGVEYNVATDSVDVVTVHDYSDRPQFIGQISSGQLIYSTRPTSVREPGTIRIIDPGKDQTRELNRGSEIFVSYAAPAFGRAIVANALSAAVTQSRGIRVCPRALRAGQADPDCVTGTATVVWSGLRALEDAGLTDTRLDLGSDIASIALTDTTFVAVSRDNSTIAFGEGASDPGRVFLFKDVGGILDGSSTETEDLLGNADERVIGLALNGDGTVGAARGQRAYFFDDALRLEGETVVGTSAPVGGIALHPSNVGYPGSIPEFRRGFVSAVDAAGVPYIDIIDTFTFKSIRRIYVRDRVVGTLGAAEVLPGDPEFGSVALRLFGITTSGIVEIGLSESDLK